MTGEISSLLQSIHLSNRGLPGQDSEQVSQGQGVAAVRQADGSRSPDKQGAAEAGEHSAPAQALDSETLNSTVSDLNVLAQRMHRELKFTVDKDSGEMVVKIIDRETDEVLRQIPQEEILEMRKRLADAAGVIFRGSV